MKDLSHYFQTFDDARPRTIEILIAVGDKGATPPHGLQFAPAGAVLKKRHLLKRPRHVEAARMHEIEIRVGGNNLVPIGPGRRLARHAKQILATSQWHELWHPVATGHQRIYPLDHGAARARSRSAALLHDAGHARFQFLDQTFALAFASKRAGDFSDVLPDVGEAVGLKRNDLHLRSTPRAQRRLDVLEAYGTDVALVLRDDDIGPKRFEPLRIDTVDGEPFLHDGLHAGVNVVARASH